MNNLKALKVSSLPIDDIKGQIVFVSIGDGRKTKEIYYLRGNSLICINLSDGNEIVFHIETGNVIRAEYMTTQNKVTISTSKSVVIVDCNSKGFYKYDFQQEVIQTGWNNTYDYVACILKDGTIQTFVFDIRFELIPQGKGNIFTVVPIREDVGWGSSEAQFQGPLCVDETEATGPQLAPIDNKKPVVSWRGNNDEFVVSYYKDGVRQFKGFDHLCVPRTKSERCRGRLYGPIAWKPQRNIIAAAIYQDLKNYIALFEINGLFRMLFPLVDIYYPITFLSWSSCGTVLNVTQEDEKGNTHICLYVTSNSRWYMKQHLVFGKSNPLCTARWTVTSPRCVEILVVTKQEVIQYKFKFQFDSDHRNNIIAAINGKTIRIHAFRDSVDPPPSCSRIIVLKNPINMIAFHPSKDMVAAIDSSNIMTCFAINDAELNVISESLLSNPIFPLHINHLFWKGDIPHMIIENIHEEYSSSLYEFDIISRKLIKNQNFNSIYAIEHIDVIDDVIITHDAQNRTIYKVEENPFTTTHVPYPLQVILLKYGSDIFCLTLTPEQELYLDEELIYKGITSMMIYKQFFLMTDSTTLYTLKLTRYLVETLGYDCLSEFHTRPLNEVAYLVCMMGNSPQIVLHTPRGNLEIISCRSMEVRAVEKKISKGEWREALTYMRLARMNWNLLIDLNSDRFYKNLAQIVAECNAQHELNSIVAEISDENCLTTIYKNAIEIIPYTPLNKRDNFLNKLGTLLDQGGSFSEYLPTVLKICVDQNNTEKAISYASALLRRSSTTDSTKIAEKAITILRIHLEAEQLFRAALLIFDLELADLVAKTCQMNPQETNPILNELNRMDNLEKRLSIHLRYQNWEEAVTYMIRKKDSNRAEVLEFIEKHDISKRAYLESTKLKDVLFKNDIVLLYAQKLISLGFHYEAGVILVQHSFYDRAVHQFKLALDSKKCLEYLPLSSFTENDKKQLFLDMAVKLISAGRISEAASVYENQIEDYVAAVNTLAHGRLFMDAIRVAKMYKLIEMIDVEIIPQIFDSVHIIMDQVDIISVRFKTYVERLNRLRNIKRFNYAQLEKRSRIQDAVPGSTVASTDSFASRRLKALEKERITEFETPSSQPDAEVQSIISVGSRCSSKSSVSSTSTVTPKQVRKMQKQKQDTTEGSRFEDIALMRELHIMITQVFKFGPEARELFLTLIEYSSVDMFGLKYHHSKIYDLQKLMKDEVHNIWDDDFKTESSVMYIAENAYYMDEQFRTIPAEVSKIGFSWIVEMLYE